MSARIEDAGQTAETPNVDTWGWLPALSLVGALGLLLIALADTSARAASHWADFLFWVGLFTLFVPVVARLLRSDAARRERIGLVIVLGIGLYLAKIFHSPRQFTFSDELINWRTTSDILRTHHLFARNPLLVINALYPGMQNVASALVSLSGLPIFGAGILLLGVGRFALVLAIYLLFEAAADSARIASIATVLYMANPNFVFFDAQFSYETLAIPFALLALAAIARRIRAKEDGRLGWTLVAVLALGVVVTTHHLTTYTLVTFLALWSVVYVFDGYRGSGRAPRVSLGIVAPRSGPANAMGPNGIALLAVVAATTWLVYIATQTLRYLGTNFLGSLRELLQLILGEATRRELFRGFAGQPSPLWERATAVASVMLILLVLPVGLFQIIRRYRQNSLAVAMAVGALAYPLSLVLRIAQSGAEISNRTSEFVFIPVAFVLAVGVTRFQVSWASARFARIAVVAWATVIFAGGTIIGWAFWARLPGPYLVVADSRSIESQGVAAAEWTRVVLGPGNTFAADRINRLLIGSYGEQNPVTGYVDDVPVYLIYFAPSIGANERTLLQRGNVRYLVVDRRLSTGLPLVGIYFEQGEPDASVHQVPMDPTLLAKFDNVAGVNRIFDSGDIVIYDVGALSGAR